MLSSFISKAYFLQAVKSRVKQYQKGVKFTFSIWGADVVTVK